MSSSLQQKPAGSGEPSPSGPWQRWTGVATVLGTAFALIGLVVALFAWLRPQSPADKPDPTAAATAGPAKASPAASGTRPAPGTPAPAAAGAVLLDSGEFPPVAGVDDVVEVPRGVTASHPIAIRCPTNETSDPHSEVTFLLRGRYYQFDATVRPYYPKGADQRSVTHVTALIGTRQRDGTLAITEAGTQKGASMAAPAALRATVAKAENLILRVECQDPNGTVLLTDARLTP